MRIKHFVLALCGVMSADAAQFDKPIRLTAESPLRVESPGYAAPCVTDLDGDGKNDLLVGQFSEGKIRVFKGKGGGKYAAGEWLKAEGAVATVPGVW